MNETQTSHVLSSLFPTTRMRSCRISHHSIYPNSVLRLFAYTRLPNFPAGYSCTQYTDEMLSFYVIPNMCFGGTSLLNFPVLFVVLFLFNAQFALNMCTLQRCLIAVCFYTYRINVAAEACCRYTRAYWSHKTFQQINLANK